MLLTETEHINVRVIVLILNKNCEDVIRCDMFIIY